MGDDVLVGGMPFVKSGDCTDPEIRENHAKALVTALELGSKATQMLVGLEKNMETHQGNVCRKLEEIRTDLKDVTNKLTAGDQNYVMMRRDISDGKKDADSIAANLREHIENHPEVSVQRSNTNRIEKHLDWHEKAEEKEEDRKFLLFRDIRTPVLRWLLVGILSLAVLGAVITAFTTLLKIVPALDVIHSLELKENTHKNGKPTPSGKE